MYYSVYIVLTQTTTTVARIIKLFTRRPYNHSSITSDSQLNEMYSFCRTYIRKPLPATFNKEFVGKGILQYNSHIPCEVYEIKLNEEQYKKYNMIIQHFISNRNLYEYNIIGLWSILFHRNIPRKHKYVCSQFVAYVLSQLNIELKKDVFMNSPEDLRYISSAKLIYSGELGKYHDIIKKPNISQLPFSPKYQLPL